MKGASLGVTRADAADALQAWWYSTCARSQDRYYPRCPGAQDNVSAPGNGGLGMWRTLSALTFAAVLLAGDAWAQMGGRGGHGHTVRSGVEAQVHLHRGMTERGLDEGKQFKVTRPPANGAARVVVSNLSSGTGKPIRVAQVFYKSKKGFTGSDSFTYQSVARNGAVQNFTLSVNVVP